MIFPKIKNSNSKQKIINLLALSVLVIALVVYFLAIPFADQIKKSKKTIVAEKIKLERQLIRQKNSAEIEKTINQVKNDIKIIEDSYINKNNQLEFITTLEGIASANKVEQNINLTQIGNKDKKSSYIESPLVLELSGRHDNLIKYLLDIEALNYYINIHSFEIFAGQNIATNGAISDALNDNNKKNDNLRMRLTATTYWR